MARESVKILEHRQGTDYEDLVFVDTMSGKVLAQTQDDTYRAVKASKSMVKAIKEGEERRFIAIHNHPGSSLPSFSDLVIAAKRRYKYGLIACHNDRVIKYSSDKNSSNESMRLVDSVLNRANIIYQKSDFKTDKWKKTVEE